jgi:hypothetical protein
MMRHSTTSPQQYDGHNSVSEPTHLEFGNHLSFFSYDDVGENEIISQPHRSVRTDVLLRYERSNIYRSECVL